MQIRNPNVQVTGVVGTLPIFDEQRLGRFVLDAELTGDLIAYVAVSYEVEVVSFHLVFFQVPAHLQAVLRHRADGAAGTVLKDETGNHAAAVNDRFDVIDGIDGAPVHKK